MRRSAITIAASAALVTAGLAAPFAHAAGSNLVVAKTGDHSDCAKAAAYHSIQDAVNAATSGSTITVCPNGVYQEYVSVPATKTNLSIKGKGGPPGPTNTTAPEILYPTTDNPTPSGQAAQSLVTINGATNLDLEGFKVSGPYTDDGCRNHEHFGIYVGAGATAHVQHDYVTHIEDADPSLRGCQDGIGVEVGNGAGVSDDGSDTGNGHIETSIVDSYQKAGILVRGNGSSAKVENNRVTGAGPTTNAASNGIEFLEKAAGTIQNNTVSANQYSSSPQASGILAWDPGHNFVVQNNKLSANDYNVAVGGFNGGTVQNNETTGGAYGLDVFDNTTGTLLQNNQTRNATTNGILNESDSSGNKYVNNQASGNGSFDCQDDSTGSGTAGTGNVWQGDKGATAQPAGICKK